MRNQYAVKSVSKTTTQATSHSGGKTYKQAVGDREVARRSRQAAIIRMHKRIKDSDPTISKKKIKKALKNFMKSIPLSDFIAEVRQTDRAGRYHSCGLPASGN